MNPEMFIFHYAGLRGYGEWQCPMEHVGIARSLLCVMNGLQRDGRFAAQKGLPEVKDACEASIVLLDAALAKVATFVGNPLGPPTETQGVPDEAVATSSIKAVLQAIASAANDSKGSTVNDLK